MPLSQIVSASIEDGAVAPVDLSSVAQYYGFKNRLINGAMQFAQRGTSFTNVGSGAPPTYTLDRWFGFRGVYAANLDVSQQTGFNGYQYCLRTQRTSGTSSTQYLVVNQIIESNNIYDLAGQTITLSLSLRSGANFSGGTVSVILYTSTAANQTSSGIAAGTWTGLASPISQAITPNTTGTQYTFTTAIPSNVLSMCVQIGYTPTGTAGANDYIDITGVQLEKGVTATSFDYRPYGTELSLCQRYYEVFYSDANGQGVFSAAYSTQLRAAWQFKVEKRAAATFALLSGGSWANATPSANGGKSSVGFFNASNVYYLTATSALVDVAMASASAEL
jgi:hypothetical protein